jgi:hypothetical protein
VTRDEFIDKWADRVIPKDSQKSVVKLVREFCDELDSVIASERGKERRNMGRKKGQQELAGT